VLPGRQPIWRLFSARAYRLSESARTGHRLIALIPEDASVVAQDAIVPHLSQRRRIYTLRDKAPDADFVVVAFDLSPWPNAAAADLRRLVAEREQKGYTVWRQAGEWVVLRAPQPPTPVR
jgi:hypothetical protein